jgi:hypothetical protein
LERIGLTWIGTFHHRALSGGSDKALERIKWRKPGETHLSAQQNRAQAATRVPRPHGNDRRSQGDCGASGTWPQAFIGLIDDPSALAFFSGDL